MPFEKLKSLTDVEQYLKPGTTIAALEEQAKATSDLDATSALSVLDHAGKVSSPWRR